VRARTSGLFWSQKQDRADCQDAAEDAARGELEEAPRKPGSFSMSAAPVGADGAEKLRVAEGEMQRA